MVQYQGTGYATDGPSLESSRSGTSWSAILAGGVAASGISLILLLLGSGLGFASVSPWAANSMSVAGLAVAAGIWLVVVQWLSAGIGGYLAGRLRTKWADHHSDEVFFRDTAHGFLAWGVATLIAIGISILAGASVISGAASGAGAAASMAAGSSGGVSSLYTDQLFRHAAGAPTAGGAAAPAPAAAGTSPAAGQGATASTGGDARQAEGGRILARAIGGTGDSADQDYLAQLVSEQTGLSPADAKTRVDQVVASAKDAADKARKAAAYAAIISALCLLVGAFIGATAGALGGRHRDELTVAT